MVSLRKQPLTAPITCSLDFKQAKMGRTRSERLKSKLPDQNAPKLGERATKRGKATAGSSSLRGLLSSASGGKVDKSVKSKPGIHLPGDKISPRLFEGSKVLNRGKVREEVTGANLMGQILTSKGESMVLTGDGKFQVVQEQRSPQTKMDLEELTRRLREKVKYNCLTCIKFMQSETAAKEHQAKQVEMCFVGQAGRRQRMQLKPTACKVVKERVFSDEEIRRKVEDHIFPSS